MAAPAAAEDFKQFNVRLMKTSNAVTVMKRFAAYQEKGQKVDPKMMVKKFGLMMAAAQKLAGAVNIPPKQLRPDFILVTGHSNGLLQIRNFDTGSLVASARHFNDAPVTCLQVSNSYIFTATEKYEKGGTDSHLDVYVWDMNNLAEVYMTLEGHTDRVSCIAVPAWNEETPVTGSVDKTVIVWNMKQGKRPIHILNGHQMMVKFLVLSKNYIASGSSDQSIRVWSWEGGQIDAVENAHNGPIQFMAHGVMPDTIISACGGGVVRESIVDADLHLKARWMSKQAKGQILDVAYDDSVVATCSTESGNIGFYIRVKKDVLTFTAHETTVRSLAMDSMRTLLFTGADDGSIGVWNYSAIANDEKPVQVLRASPHASAITCILLDMDARGRWERIFTCSVDQSIFVLDLMVDRDAHKRELKHPVRLMTEIEPTGTIVTANGSECNLWNTALMRHKGEGVNGEPDTEEGVLEGHKENITGIAFSQDNLRLITVGEDALMIVWNIALYDEAGYQHEEFFTKDGEYELRGPATCLSNPHGELIGVGLTKTQHGVVELMNYVTGERIVHFAVTGPPTRMCFIGEDGAGVSHAVLQLQDGSVVLTDLEGAVLGTIAQPLEKAGPGFLHWHDAAFNPPQMMVLTVKQDLVKEHRIVLSGAKNLSDIRNSFVAKVPSRITCIDVLRQAASLHCVAGTENGAFHCLDRTGQLQYTVTWDGATEHHTADQTSSFRRPRRTSLCDVGDKDGGGAAATSVSAHLQGRYIVMGYHDGLCMVWDTANLRVIKRFYPHHAPLRWVWANSALKRVMSACDGAMRIELLHGRDDRLADTPLEDDLPARRTTSVSMLT